MTKLKISEIFKSIQGESSYSGFPFFFIRLTGCNLRCSYCDTQYSYSSGNELTIKSIIDKIEKSTIDKVLLTGGEPLLQENIYILIDKLTEIGKKVFIETNGSILTNKLRKEVIKIIDFKTPSSLMNEKNNFDNINFLNEEDEVKFVISDKNDFLWSIDIVNNYNLHKKTKNILFSPVANKLEPKTLANWILDKDLNIRVQIQLHKILDLK